MAIKISGTNVIDNSRNLTNISAFDSSVTKIWSTVTANTSNVSLVNRQHHTVLSNGNIITLPANPSLGWEVVVVIGGNFNNTTIGRNGRILMGYNEDLIIDLPYAALNFTYTSDSYGWRLS